MSVQCRVQMARLGPSKAEQENPLLYWKLSMPAE